MHDDNTTMLFLSEGFGQEVAVEVTEDGDCLDTVLEKMAQFLRASGYGYVDSLEAITE
jgi:hypothetical protein